VKEVIGATRGHTERAGSGIRGSGFAEADWGSAICSGSPEARIPNPILHPSLQVNSPGPLGPNLEPASGEKAKTKPCEAKRVKLLVIRNLIDIRERRSHDD